MSPIEALNEVHRAVRKLGLHRAQVHDLPLLVDLACHVSEPNAFAERI